LSSFFIAAKAGNYEIDGYSYFIDPEEKYETRDEAVSACRLRDKSLVRFETKEKWDAITVWIAKDLGVQVKINPGSRF